MKNRCTVPPDCCVIIEMEPGARLGYRKAVLLNEIEALESLSKAARTSKITIEHAREIVLQMNSDFSTPLVSFNRSIQDADSVYLSRKGKDMVTAYWQLFEPVWNDIQRERSRHY